jgi:hypothetical protein
VNWRNQKKNGAKASFSLVTGQLIAFAGYRHIFVPFVTFANPTFFLALVAMVFFRFRYMNRPMGVLRRGIDRVQFERDVTGVDQVMPFAGGNDEDIIIIDISLKIQAVWMVAHQNKTLSLLNTDELIEVRMDF